jgi:hypothetical protein
MVTTLLDLDITKPDGATEPVAVLDDYQREAKEATINSFGAEHALDGPHAFLSGNTAARPATGFAGRIYINTQTKTIQLDSGAAWADLIHYYQRQKVGSYTGDGTSARGITGLDFGPTSVMVVPLSGTNPAFIKTVDMASGNSHKFSDNTTDTAGIKTLDSDGFTVDANANVNAVLYQYVAIRDIP